MKFWKKILSGHHKDPNWIFINLILKVIWPRLQFIPNWKAQFRVRTQAEFALIQIPRRTRYPVISYHVHFIPCWPHTCRHFITLGHFISEVTTYPEMTGYLVYSKLMSPASSQNTSRVRRTQLSEFLTELMTEGWFCPSSCTKVILIYETSRKLVDWQLFHKTWSFLSFCNIVNFADIELSNFYINFWEKHSSKISLKWIICKIFLRNITILSWSSKITCDN